VREAYRTVHNTGIRKGGSSFLVKNLMIEKRFYNAKELGVYLSMSEDTIRKWAVRGRIPFSKFGKALRFDIKRIESWLKKKECVYTRKTFS